MDPGDGLFDEPEPLEIEGSGVPLGCGPAPLKEVGILTDPLSPTNGFGVSPRACSSFAAFLVVVRFFRSFFGGASCPGTAPSASLSLAGRLRRSFVSGAGVGRGLSISWALLPASLGGGTL